MRNIHNLHEWLLMDSTFLHLDQIVDPRDYVRFMDSVDYLLMEIGIDLQ